MKALNVFLSVVGWTSFVFLFLFGCAALPTISAFVLFAAALICLPIKPAKKLVSKIIPHRTLRILAVAVLFVVGMLLFPTDDTPEDPTGTETLQTSAEQEPAEEIEPEEKTEPDAPEIKPEPETEPEPETQSPEEVRAEYISGCETVVYKDVERNPGNFEGKTIAIKGEVIQVAEGWFNAVTLRIESEEGIWYATYTRNEDEPRILKDDVIVAYGKCTGVKTYSTVLGSSMTIPAMEIEYYDLVTE
jgi:hypothetical protein